MFCLIILVWIKLFNLSLRRHVCDEKWNTVIKSDFWKCDTLTLFLSLSLFLPLKISLANTHFDPVSLYKRSALILGNWKLNKRGCACSSNRRSRQIMALSGLVKSLEPNCTVCCSLWPHRAVSPPSTRRRMCEVAVNVCDILCCIMFVCDFQQSKTKSVGKGFMY